MFFRLKLSLRCKIFRSLKVCERCREIAFLGFFIPENKNGILLNSVFILFLIFVKKFLRLKGKFYILIVGCKMSFKQVNFYDCKITRGC